MTSRVLVVVISSLMLAGFGQMSFGDVCSSLPPDDIAPCGSRNTSRASCLAKGCCWNDTIAKKDKNNSSLKNIHCYRSIRRNGTCIRYPEHGTCFPFLNSSVPQFRDTPRFIDYYIGLNGTELLLKKYHKFLDIIAKDAASEGCLDKMRILLCQYILTPCSEESFPIPICRRECDRFEERCPKTFQKLLGGARIDMSRMKVNLVHVDLTDCNNLGYEEDLAKVGKKCYASGIFSHSSTKAEDKTTVMIAGIVVAGLFVNILIFIFLCRFLYRRKKKPDGKKIDPGIPRLTRALSVKDHINNLYADDPLRSKIFVDDLTEIKQYPVDKVAYEKDLGEGQFGQVFQGRAVGLKEDEPDSEVIVAVKTLKKGSSSEAKAEFHQEACLMNFLSHPNIVKLLAVSSMEEPYCMIFEFMSKGDLSEYLRSSEPLMEYLTVTPDYNNNKNYLSQDTLIKMSVDVAKGLQYLASHSLIHRDVATRNCLVADDLTIKISDFGLSRNIYSNHYYKIERETMLPIRWLSPESIVFGKFTLESDIYSYGVLLWEIFTFSMQPYYGYTNQEVLKFIPKSVHLAKPDFCPEFVYRIMQDCWRKRPDLRPDYQSIIDRLNGQEVTYDHPVQWPFNQRCDTALYQNVRLQSNGVWKIPDLDEDPENEEGNKMFIGMPLPEEISGGKNGLFMVLNPLYEARRKENSDDGSCGNTNIAVDIESEA